MTGSVEALSATLLSFGRAVRKTFGEGAGNRKPRTARADFTRMREICKGCLLPSASVAVRPAMCDVTGARQHNARCSLSSTSGRHLTTAACQRAWLTPLFTFPFGTGRVRRRDADLARHSNSSVA